MLASPRKSLFASVALAGALVVLGACGQSDTAPSASSGQPASLPASTAAGPSSDTPSTRMLKTVKGEIEIPTDPKRIVAGYYHGTLLALGMQPVGGSKDWWMGSPFLKEQEAAMTDIGSPASTEKVLALNPDLIVINDTLVDQYDNFSKIAPTLLVEYSSIHNIREEVKVFGELLGKQKEADAWLAGYAAKAEQAREKLKDTVKPGATAALLEIDGKSLAVLGDNYGRGGEVIYNALQFQAPAWIKQNVIDNGVQYQEISIEKLPEIADTDYIFLSSYTETTAEELQALIDNPVWKSLPAYKNGHIIPLDYKTYFYFDPVSVLGQVDRLTEAVLQHK
ncbi:iron-hydroxamate ABC transporter substrate-binding protein [Cohnella sp. 56]|uniref:iron-hydroxamate ABC transporter substrate-binding protein n=1 Tax=Cohnella sp. 56 TaxID=3113722 RepID=UPI0030E86E8A